MREAGQARAVGREVGHDAAEPAQQALRVRAIGLGQEQEDRLVGDPQDIDAADRGAQRGRGAQHEAPVAARAGRRAQATSTQRVAMAAAAVDLAEQRRHGSSPVRGSRRHPTRRAIVAADAVVGGPSPPRMPDKCSRVLAPLGAASERRG